MRKLSIVIATYNRADYLLRTLNSLSRQTLDPELFEVVVVNNNSSDRTPEVFDEFARCHPQLHLRMVIETSQGISYARNCGIHAAEGEYIVFLDDDEEACSEFAKSYFCLFENNINLDAAGGAVIPVYEAPLPVWYSYYIEKMITGALNLGDRMVPFRGNRYPGVGNSGFRRSLFERYGNFNTNLGRTGTNPMGGEEKDFFLRVRAQGVRYYYVPGAEIYHITPEFKLTKTYFERLTRMIGVSERIRTQSEGGISLSKRMLLEVVKWGGAVLFALGYLLRLQPMKGWYLLRMRWNITCGLLAGSSQ